MVLWELLTFQLPWATDNPWHIVSVIMGGGRLEVPPEQALPGASSGFAGLPAYVALMQRCWAQSPLDRPVFEDITRELRQALAPAVPVSGFCAGCCIQGHRGRDGTLA